MSNIAAGFPASPDIAKAQAKRLRAALNPDSPIGHSQSLELVARLHGEPSWGRMNSLFPQAGSLTGTVAANAAVSPPQARAEGPMPDNHLDQRGLHALRAGLKKARPTEVTAKALAQAKELLRDEILSVQSFESWLDRLDVSLGGMVFDMGIENFIRFLEIETITRYRRPRVRDKQVIGGHGVRAAGFAAALIRLARYGFDTHPEVFVEPLLPGIRKAHYVDQDEVDCLWYEREQKKFTFRASWFDARNEVDEVETEDFTMPNGTKASVWKSPGELGRIHRITLIRG